MWVCIYTYIIMKNILSISLLITSLYIAGIFFATKDIKAADGFVASGNLNPSAVIETHKQKMETTLKNNWNVVKRDHFGPDSTAMTLSVSGDGVVSGWGKIGPMKSDYWAMTETGMTNNPIGHQDYEYLIGFVGTKNKWHLSGEAVIKYRSRLTDKGARTYRTSWKAQSDSKTVTGTIKDVYKGQSVSFKLNIGEGSNMEIDEEIGERWFDYAPNTYSPYYSEDDDDDVEPDEDDDTSGDSNGDKGEGTPGFEAIAVIVALAIAFIILRRKKL